MAVRTLGTFLLIGVLGFFKLVTVVRVIGHTEETLKGNYNLDLVSAVSDYKEKEF